MTQNQALDILKMGYNVFLTGAAGSGKTFLLNKYIRFLKNRKVKLGITASTGIAATHISGRTIHSWAGIGIKDNINKKEYSVILKNHKTASRLRETAVIIIDEISMLHPYQLDMVDKILKFSRNNQLPFGGAQVILCGDLFQLPPVSQNRDSDVLITDSLAWNNSEFKCCYLDEQHRQEDPVLLKILNNMRNGKLDEKDFAVISSRFNAKEVKGSILTKLYTHNSDVDSINNLELLKISALAKRYTMRSWGRPSLVESLKRGCLASEELILKTGAQVMFVKNNYEKGYVNGTLGKICDFDKGFPIVEKNNGERILALPEKWQIEEDGVPQAEITQVPLRLAWAITVHKSQGMTVDGAVVNLGKCFEYGMGYVALSRVRRLECLHLLGINDVATMVNPKVQEIDCKLIINSDKAVCELDTMSRQDILLKQKDFMLAIVPPELYNNIDEVMKNDFFVYENKQEQKRIPKHILRLLKTKEMLIQEASLEEIAKENDIKIRTVINHIERLYKKGERVNIKYLLPLKEDIEKIKSAFDECETEFLKPVYEFLSEKYSYETLQLVKIIIE